MFKEMRRKDREVGREDTINLLEKGQYGVLSTVGENGYPYGVPVNYVYAGGGIYFHCAVEGAKVDNILFNNKVSFCVVGDTAPVPEKFSFKYESAIVFGKCAEVFEKEKTDALLALVRKYSAGFMEKGMKYIDNDSSKTKVFKIDIEHISGKVRM